MATAATELPGKLDWQPAYGHLELMAPATAAAIGELDAYVAPIDADLADTAAFCEAYQVTLAESANCVVVEGRRGENTTLAAVMVLATDKADVNKTIRKHLGVRKMSFAAMDSATELTSMAHGGINPVGLPADWPILVDENVAQSGWVVIGSGIRGSKIALRGEDIARLPGAEVLDLVLPTP